VALDAEFRGCGAEQGGLGGAVRRVAAEALAKPKRAVHDAPAPRDRPVAGQAGVVTRAGAAVDEGAAGMASLALAVGVGFVEHEGGVMGSELA
jgi:hypothetical protein